MPQAMSRKRDEIAVRAHRREPRLRVLLGSKMSICTTIQLARPKITATDAGVKMKTAYRSAPRTTSPAASWRNLGQSNDASTGGGAEDVPFVSMKKAMQAMRAAAISEVSVLFMRLA